MYKNTHIIAIVLFIVLCGAVIYREKVKACEGFASLSMADKTLLDGPYKARIMPRVTKDNYSDLSKHYPIFPAHSQINNNELIWKSPTNGRCTRPELCEDYYIKTPQEKKSELAAPSIRGRVNYFNTTQ